MPAAVERLGLGYDVVSAINPHIIHAQVKGFGGGRRYEKGLSFDPIAQAAGGVMSVTGPRDGRPIKPGPTIGDTGTGVPMAFSIVIALLAQRSPNAWGSRLACQLYLRLVGRPFAEGTVLRAAPAYEKATNWRSRRPKSRRWCSILERTAAGCPA